MPKAKFNKCRCAIHPRNKRLRHQDAYVGTPGVYRRAIPGTSVLLYFVSVLTEATVVAMPPSKPDPHVQNASAGTPSLPRRRGRATTNALETAPRPAEV